MEENSCLAQASTLQRNGFKCESTNLLNRWSVLVNHRRPCAYS